jgi:hypothetical protein
MVGQSRNKIAKAKKGATPSHSKGRRRLERRTGGVSDVIPLLDKLILFLLFMVCGGKISAD